MASRASSWVGLLFVGLVVPFALPPRALCAMPGDGDGPSVRALASGRAQFERHRARVSKRELWTLIDYDRPFTAVRLWVLDARDGDGVLMASRVSHAWKSGVLHATRFSNRPGSNLSSIGSFVTARRTYEGSFGHSLRVRGLEPGRNDNVLRRAIVFHPASMTHSLGCFMLPPAHSAAVIDAIAGGSFVYVHKSES